MVKASSIQRSLSSEQIKKVGAGLLALVLVLGVGYGIIGIFRDSDGSKMVPPTSTPISKSISDDVLKREYPVSQPKAMPQNFVRTKVEILSITRTQSGCEEVKQNYQGSKDPLEAYIDLYSYASTCSFERPEDAEIYNVGDYSGWISDPDATETTDDDLTSLLLEITVRKGLIRVETDLPEKQISKILKKFVPFSSVPPKDSLKITSP